MRIATLEALTEKEIIVIVTEGGQTIPCFVVEHLPLHIGNDTHFHVELCDRIAPSNSLPTWYINRNPVMG